MSDEFYERTVEVSLSPEVLKRLRNAAGEEACLVVIAGPRLGTRTVLGEAPLVIGRGSACQLQLEADSVSRQHARIEYADGSHWLEDLGSTNGSYLNDRRVSRNVLRDGDRIGIGKVTLKYLASGNIEASYHEEVQRLMRHDGLTGVHNKQHFDEAFAALLGRGRAEGRPVSLLVFDLDHFKQVNDTHGHPAGDAVLRQVANVASSTTRDWLFARTGGEEFAVAGLWPLDAGFRLAEALRAAIERHRCVFEGKHIPVTLSVGVAERPAGSDETGESLYRRADERLYAAKAAGRNCVR